MAENASDTSLAAERPWVALLLAWLALIYLPDIGRGFLKDDFRWIAEARIAGVADLWHVLTGNLGFYRPVVTLTFSLNEALFGLWAYGYALTNFCFLAMCVVAVHGLCRAVGLGRETAAMAGALWALNFHGIGGALLWISGRTSLLVTLFAVACVTAWVRGQVVRAAVWFGLALFSKEEAVVVPLLMASWSVFAGRLRADAMRLASVSAPALLAYTIARQASGAFGYASAPSYYRLSTDVAVIARNVLEYADRNATLPAAILVSLCVAARRVPRVSGRRGRLAVYGLGWAVAAHLPTLALPARSSLYVLLPSVGVALACAAAVASVLEHQSSGFRRRALVCALTLALVLWPVYQLRNQRLKHQAEISAATVSVLRHLGSRANGRHVVLRDDPHVRDNFSAAFGSAVPDIHRLVVPQAAALVLESGGRDAPVFETGVPVIVIELRDGQVVCCGPP